MGCEWSRKKPLPPPAPVLVYSGNDPRLTMLAGNYERYRRRGTLTRAETKFPMIFLDLAANADKDAHWLSFFARCRSLKIGYRITN